MRVLHQFYLDHVLNAWNWSQMVVGSLPTPSISRSYIICPHLELLINNPTQLFFLMWSGGQFVNEIFNGLHYFPPNDIIYMYKESDYIVEFFNFLVQHWCYRVLKREVGTCINDEWMKWAHSEGVHPPTWLLELLSLKRHFLVVHWSYWSYWMKYLQ